jgi:hypothetical protein
MLSKHAAGALGLVGLPVSGLYVHAQRYVVICELRCLWLVYKAS